LQRENEFRIAIYLSAILAIAVPLISGEYVTRVAIGALKYVVLAISFDILARTGDLSVGHAALFGIGAYAAALFNVYFKVPMELGPLVGGLAVLPVAIALGFITLRMKGAYFSIATLAFAEAMRVLFLYARGITFGAMGVGVPPIFGGDITIDYYVILGIAIVSILLVILLERTGINYAFSAIRENEDAASVLGVNPTKYKVLAFSLSALLAGAAGGFDAGYTTYVYPYEVFSVAISVAAMIMPIFGGLYTIEGPIIGALTIYGAEEILRGWMPFGYTLIYGLALIISILYLPKGIIGLIREVRGRTWLENLKRRTPNTNNGGSLRLR